ncbi:MAG: CsbD family protein [Terracidiphilus sp.]
MDKDRVKGAINDAAGRAKRQVGEWTGDTDAQAEGAAQQLKGKAQKVVGAVKDAARDAKSDYERERERQEADQRAADQERVERDREHAHSGHGSR